MSVNTNHYSITDNFLTNSTRFFLLLQFTSGRWGTDTSGFTSNTAVTGTGVTVSDLCPPPTKENLPR